MTPPPSLQELIDTVQRDSPGDEVLELLMTASSTVNQLETVSDALLGHYVDRCRRAGRSWSEISSALGVSKQAVHKRWSTPLADRLIDAAAAPTLERFTPRARGVLAAAEAAARQLARDQVGSQELLLGLFADPKGLAACALSGMGVRRESVEAALSAEAQAGGTGAQASGTGTQAGGTGQAGGRLAYSADAKTALRDAVAEALELGHNYIGTEHILLGLLRDPDCAAAAILAGLGVQREEAKVRLTEMLQGLAKRK